MGGIGVVYNPYAGRNRKNPGREERLKKILGNRGTWFRTENKERLLKAAAYFLEQKTDIVAVSGGDGTLHQVFTAIINTYGGRHLEHPNLYFSGPTARVVMEPREKEPWMIDGDIYTTEGPLCFSVGPTVTLLGKA